MVLQLFQRMSRRIIIKMLLLQKITNKLDDDNKNDNGVAEVVDMCQEQLRGELGYPVLDAVVFPTTSSEQQQQDGESFQSIGIEHVIQSYEEGKKGNNHLVEEGKKGNNYYNRYCYVEAVDWQIVCCGMACLTMTHKLWIHHHHE